VIVCTLVNWYLQLVAHAPR